MIFNNSPVTREQFLAEYWQQKPLLIRQALPGFTPELDSNDIAGLACDDLAESRLITGSYPEHDWQIRYGPFSEKDFSRFPDTHWTLLVQDVEKHYPPLKRLIDLFSFLPNWRIDDLMASVAGPGGSVGPHVDQYDVFLLQAQGRRRWEIAESFDSELLPACDLKVLRHFSAEQGWLLEAGDMLYLPPGIAHHGVAEGACMTWSIGMRAPSAADFFLALGEWLADQENEGGRYRDPGLEAASHSGEIDPKAIARFQQFLQSPFTDNREITAFLGSFLSRYRLAHEPAPPDAATGPAELVKAIAGGETLRQNPWTRLAWIADADGAQLFAAGDRFPCHLEFAQALCDPEKLSRLDQARTKQEVTLLCELLNRGHLYLEGL